MQKKTFHRGQATIYCGDATKLKLRREIHAVCTDPPYGCNNRTNYTRFRGGLHPSRNHHLGIANDKKPFDPSWLLAYPKVCLFGFQFFAASLPVGSTLVWLKKRDKQLGTFLSDAEIAWLNQGKGCYVYKHIWNGFDRESERGKTLHPNQKPVALWHHVFDMLKLEEGQTLFDPYCGSGSVGVAAIERGLRYVGVELIQDYWAIACDRIRSARRVG